MSSVSAGVYSSVSAADLRQSSALPSAADAAIASNDALNSAPTIEVAVVVDLSEAAQAVAAVQAEKNFDAVARDARATIDLAYQERGTKADAHTTDAEWKEIFGSLDRRSLYAVASNQGGQFSELEQTQAKALLAKQRAEVLELGNVIGNDPTAALNAAVAYLGNLSPEERAALPYDPKRSSLQSGYELLAQNDSASSAKYDDVGPLAKLVGRALDSFTHSVDPSRKFMDAQHNRQANAFAAAIGAASSVDIIV